MACVKTTCTEELFEQLKLSEEIRACLIGQAIYCDFELSIALTFGELHCSTYPDLDCTLFIDSIAIRGWISGAHDSGLPSMTLYAQASPLTINRQAVENFLNEMLCMLYGVDGYAIDIKWPVEHIDLPPTYEEEVTRLNRLAVLIHESEYEKNELRMLLHIVLGGALHFHAFLDKVCKSGTLGLSEESRRRLEEAGYIKKEKNK